MRRLAATSTKLSLVTLVLLCATLIVSADPPEKLSFEELFSKAYEVHVSEAGVPEKAAHWEKLLAAYPDHPEGVQVMIWLLKNKFGEEQADREQALRYLDQHIGRVTDASVRDQFALERMGLLGQAGRAAEFRAQTRKWIAESKVTTSNYRTLMKAGLQAGGNDAVLELGEWYLGYLSAQRLREWWTDLAPLSDDEIQPYLNKHRALSQMLMARAHAAAGRADQALALFERASGIASRSVHGTFYDLNLHWAQTLIDEGRARDAMSLLVAEARIEGRPEVVAMLERACSSAGLTGAACEKETERIFAERAPRVPAFSARDYSGAMRPWDEIKGAVTLISFWYPTCGDCLVELPILNQLLQRYRSRGLRIVVIDSLADTKKALGFIEEQQLELTMLENGKGQQEVSQSLFGIAEHPSSYLVDQSGRVLAYHRGFSPGDEVKLEAEIVSALEASAR